MRMRNPDDCYDVGPSQCGHSWHPSAAFQRSGRSCLQDKTFFQVIPGLKGYIGRSGMTHATLAGVVRALWPNPTGGISDSFFIESQEDSDGLNLSVYYIDMDVAGEGLLVSYWTE